MKPRLNAFRQLSFQGKLIWLMLGTCALALLLACSAFVAFDIAQFRRAMPGQLGVLAQIIADNAKAPLTFDDQRFAQKTLLGSLTAQPHVSAAVLYDSRSNVFALYIRKDRAGGTNLPPIGPDTHRFRIGALQLHQSIVDDAERLGTVFIESDMRELDARVRAYCGIAAVVLLLSLLGASVVSIRLQRFVSKPVLELAETARKVAARKDYSLRARKFADDELGAFTDDFNQMLAQIQQQDQQLKQSRERYEVALLGSRDGIWDWDIARDVAHLSARWKNMIGYAEDELAGGVGHWKQRLHPEDRDRTVRILAEYLGGQRPNYEVEFRLRHKDGSYRWILARGAALRDSNGKPFRMAGSHTDITDRKLAEAALFESERNLNEAARRAGMAEVATGVLHNVGNVLNSVNVSATLVKDRLQHSKAGALGLAKDLLRNHLADIGSYITRDPKGRLLPQFLIDLSEELDEERSSNVRELDSLMHNIEHIKEIVATQQSYATVSGIIETVSPAQLLEHAVRINGAALAHRCVRLVREYNRVPMLCVDKHKVLQILVNLLSNATHALENVPLDQRQITLGIHHGPAGSVKFTVRDNGVGIAPENLARIFSHGFTTRKHGHGFGLHSGAIAAQEMGGSLRAQSDGLGTGAVFTLELPVDGSMTPITLVQSTPLNSDEALS